MRSILALTATATKATEAAVCSVLRIPSPQGVFRDSAIRSNLRLSVLRVAGSSTNAARGGWQTIVRLFRAGGSLEHSKSAIVYCAWKSDANSLAMALTGAGITAKPYHAGLDVKERAGVEAAFSRGRLRVVTATVAFGMGVDISSVDAVVHATMPRSLEEYVQQIGRAGRDGSEAQCCVCLSDADFVALRSLAYSSFMLKESVAEVLERVFATEGSVVGQSKRQDDDDDEGAGAGGRRRFGLLPCKKVAGEVDMLEESIEAVLGYLEAEDEPLVRVLPKAAVTVKVSFYAVAAEDLADEHQAVRALLLTSPKPRNGLYSAAVARLACAAQKPPGAVLQDLQMLAQRKLVGFELSRDQGLAFEVLHEPGDLQDLTDCVYGRLCTMLRCQVARLDTSYRAMASATATQNDQQRQEVVLRGALENYFACEAAGMEDYSGGADGSHLGNVDLEGLPLRVVGESMLQTAKAILRRNREQGGPSMTALALARVLHGTAGASMPRDAWVKRMGPFWGSLKDADFTHVFRVATMASNSFQ